MKSAIAALIASVVSASACNKNVWHFENCAGLHTRDICDDEDWGVTCGWIYWDDLK